MSENTVDEIARLEFLLDAEKAAHRRDNEYWIARVKQLNEELDKRAG